MVPKDVLVHDMLPLFTGLASDDQDSVRHLTVADLIVIAKQLSPQETQELLGAGIRNLWADKSWRVRYSVADGWVDLAMAIGGEHAGDELVSAFVRLIKDNEAEVRSAIAKQIPGICENAQNLTCLTITGFCKLVPPPVILHEILGPVKELVGDPNPQVRAAFGENLSGLAPILGKEATIEHLLPMFLQMLKDDDSKVRLNIISKLELVNAGTTPKPTTPYWSIG
jgi:serine/threonine-protein phosphatase 2A regulatory subunit A